MTTPDLKPRSRDVTDGLEKAAARGMLRAVGLGDDDFAKPQIGIASSWNEITPCNLSLDRLAKAAKDGVHAAGGYPLEFGTISVSEPRLRTRMAVCFCSGERSLSSVPSAVPMRPISLRSPVADTRASACP